MPSTNMGRSYELPRPLTSLIGREREIAAVASLFEHSGARLVTLTGAGGIGKTRLALGVAEQLRAMFPDGVWFVSLASIAGPALVLPAIARVLGIAEQGDLLLLERLTGHLRERRALLVLDNFEHVIAASTEIAQLLAACPALGVLVTSREPLRLSGEHEYPVPPLEVAEASNGRGSALLPDSEAIRLFVERAQLGAPGFILTISNAPDVVEICRRLDGVPLALELAAARIKMLAPEELLERLDQPLALLTGGPRDAPERQQTMRGTLQWSYDLLPADEQQLFRALSVFAGGWTLAAAEAIAGSEDVLEPLTSLVDKGLVRRMDVSGVGTRYGMLEPVRQFAWECLEAQGEELTCVRDLHACYYQSTVENLQYRMDGPDGPAVSDRVEAEHDNLRAALTWLRESGQIEQGLLLVGELGNFWFQRGYVNEGWAHADAFLNAPVPSRRTLGRARALRPACWLKFAQGEVEAALRLIDEALGIFQEHGDQIRIAQSLFALGLCRERLGDEAQARCDYEHALALSREQADDTHIVRLLFHLGNLAINQGDLEGARDRLEEAIAIARSGGLKQVIALTVGSLGRLARLSGDDERAATLYAEQLTLFYELGHPQHIAPALNQIAALVHRQRQFETAVCLCSVASALRERIGSQRVDYDPDLGLNALRDVVPEPVFDVAWERGRTMALDDAVDFALRALESVHAEAMPSLPAGLTPRESEVLRLIAAGRSNREMAGDLFLSVRTVERHVTNIYAKIGAHNRAEATAFALANGLAGPTAT